MTKAAIAAILASSLVAPSITQAANYEFYDAAGVNQGNLDAMLLNDVKFTNLLLGLDTYKYELDGKVYKASEINSIFTANPGLQPADLAQKVQEQGLVGEDIPTQEVAIQSVSAVNPTTVKLTFNKAVEALTKADVTVTDAKTSDKKYIKEVKLATDKLSAEVVLYEALTDKTTYKVVAAGAESQFDYTVGTVASITADAAQTVKASEATAIKYKVLDANGLDITSATEVKYESSEASITSDGKITLAAGQTAFVYVVATKADGTTVKSNRITVTAQATALAQITNYTVGTTEPNFSATDYKQNLNVQMGVTAQKLYIEGKDQFGQKADTTGVTYESLDTDVAIVDKTTGGITPVKEGTLPVRITVGDFKQIVELQVVAKGKAAVVEFDKQSVSISNKVTTPTTVKVTVKDQYGTVVTDSAVKATATVTSGTDLVTVDLSTLSNGVGTLSITPVAGKTGTAVIEVKVSDTVKASVTVNVTEAGVVDGYTVKGAVETLDKKTGAQNAEMTLSVFPVDANGVKTGDAVSNATYTVYNEKNEVANSLANKNTTEKIQASSLEEGTYTVKVKVGSLEVGTPLTFKVVDTSEKPVIKVNDNKVTETFTTATKDNILTEIAKKLTVTYAGKTLTLKENNGTPTVEGEYKISKVTYISDNSTVVASATDAVGQISALATANGTANLTVQSVEITYHDGSKTVVLPKVQLNERFTVTADCVGPTLVSATVNQGGFDAIDDTLTLTFSEDVKLLEGGTLAATNTTLANLNAFLDLDYDGGTGDEDLTASGGGTPTFDIAVTGKTMTITLKDSALSEPITSETAINISNGAKNNLTDLVGNSSAVATADVIVTDKAAPTLVSVATTGGFDAENDTMKLTFDEKVQLNMNDDTDGSVITNATTLTNVSLDFIKDLVSVTGKELVAGDTVPTFDVSVADKVVTITVKGTGATLTNAISTEKVKINDVSNIVDKANNEAAANVEVANTNS